MQREFVTYEIALGLKELGFDEECFAIFFRTILNNGRTVNYISDDWESPFYKNRTNSESNSVDIVSAPLWQQVIDWFRERYNWLIVVDVANSTEYYAAIREFDEDGCIISKIPYKNYPTYYKAREQAILKAIELCQKK